MQPIEFRAKGYDNVWHYGDLVHVTRNPHYKQNNPVPYIVSMHRHGGMLYVCERHKVQEDTIGMFIGFKDRFGNKIYSGDIVSKYRRNFIVKWNDKTAGYYLVDALNDDNTLSFGDFSDGICDGIVVGNVYDNLNLIKKQ